MIASMWGNVYGPISDDTKDHQFENTIVKILKLEEEKLDTELHGLFTIDTAKLIFKYMGGEDRYNDPRTLTRIPNNVVAALNSPESVRGINCVNHNEEDLDNFIESNEDWQPTNTENDNTIFLIYKLSKNPSHIREVVARLLQKVCELENSHTEGETLKTLKVMMWNEKQGTEADAIVRSRQSFVDELNKSWYTRRDSVIANIPNQILDLQKNFRKTLNDFNMEIWCMKQLENEEVHELLFDKGGV